MGMEWFVFGAFVILPQICAMKKSGKMVTNDVIMTMFITHHHVPARRRHINSEVWRDKAMKVLWGSCISSFLSPLIIISPGERVFSMSISRASLPTSYYRVEYLDPLFQVRYWWYSSSMPHILPLTFSVIMSWHSFSAEGWGRTMVLLSSTLPFENVMIWISVARSNLGAISSPIIDMRILWSILVLSVLNSVIPHFSPERRSGPAEDQPLSFFPPAFTRVSIIILFSVVFHEFMASGISEYLNIDPWLSLLCRCVIHCQRKRSFKSVR